MLLPNELKQRTGLTRDLVGPYTSMLRSAHGAVAALLQDDKIEAAVTWFDSGEEEDRPAGVHIRLLVEAGLITLDYDFSFDGSPDARFIPWSRVHALHVVADDGRQTVVANAWLVTETGTVELAGGGRAQLSEAVRAAKEYLR